VERIGRTSGAKYILSHTYYKHAGRPGVHTRLRGVSRTRNKELIVEHIDRNTKGYMRDFADIFPNLSATNIHNLLQELKRDGIIEHMGSRRTGYWMLSKKSSTTNDK
jgi:ATP-dependent DNA helicase RecG